MPRSVHSMMRHGLISTKAYNSTLAKTRSQKSKMAHMDDQSKDDGRGTRGEIDAGEINQHEHQRSTVLVLCASQTQRRTVARRTLAPTLSTNQQTKRNSRPVAPPRAKAAFRTRHRASRAPWCSRDPTTAVADARVRSGTNTNQERPAEDQHEQKKQEPSRQSSRHDRRRRAGSRLDRGHIGRGHRRPPIRTTRGPIPTPRQRPIRRRRRRSRGSTR